MKNWKTTLVGLGLAILIAMQTFDIHEWETWLYPVGIAALGYLAKDFNVSGTVPLLMLCASLFCLTSCTVSMSPAGKPVFGVDPVAIAQALDLYRIKHGGAKNADVIIIAPDGSTAATITPTK